MPLPEITTNKDGGTSSASPDFRGFIYFTNSLFYMSKLSVSHDSDDAVASVLRACMPFRILVPYTYGFHRAKATLRVETILRLRLRSRDFLPPRRGMAVVCAYQLPLEEDGEDALWSLGGISLSPANSRYNNNHLHCMAMQLSSLYNNDIPSRGCTSVNNLSLELRKLDR